MIKLTLKFKKKDKLERLDEDYFLIDSQQVPAFLVTHHDLPGGLIELEALTKISFSSSLEFFDGIELRQYLAISGPGWEVQIHPLDLEYFECSG